MKKFLAAALLGLALNLGAVPGVAAPATAQTARAWRLAGAYRSYDAACRKADQLERCNYETCIRKQGSYWCVYCR